MASERRKQRRIPVRIDTFCKGAAKAGMGRLADLSAGGCRITSSVPLAQGDQAVLTMYFGNDDSMTILGRVVSIGDKGIGLKFENVTPSLKFQIGEVLQSLN